MPATETINPDTETKPAADDPDSPRDWYFTFGLGHTLFVQHRYEVGVNPVKGLGVPVDGYYVIVHGNYLGARLRMIEIFGNTWSGQYSKLPPIGDLPGHPEWRELVKVPPAENGAL